ncbi:CHC2 zinc finger protein [Bordetella phage PY223]
MAIDVQTLLDSVDIVDVIGRYIHLDKGGVDYAALCPFHSESTPSFTVSGKKQFYHCFGCGAHGDAIRFVQEYQGVGFREAADIVASGKAPETLEAPKPRAPRDDKEEEREWQPSMPVPADAPPPPRTHSKKIKGKWVPCEWVSHFAYRDQSGALLGYIARFEYDSDGGRKKEYVPQTWCRNAQTGRMEWRKVSFPKPRPLYNLPQLAANPDAIVILCEGEKKADAVMRMLPDVVGVSWAGGGKAIKYTAWEPLRGRKVLIWRDADEPGLQAADGYDDPRSGAHTPGVADFLKDIAAAVKIVDPPEGVPESWDLYDAEQEGWTGAQVIEHVKAAARLPACMQPKPETPPPPADDMREAPPMDDDGYEPAQDFEDTPYRPLGYDHGRYYYLAGRAAQVIELSSSGHTKLNLLSIAPLPFWQRSYPPAKDSDGAMWDMAANALMRQCENAGVYDPAKVRGRGAWWDDGRSLLHVGGALIVDGEQRPLTDPSVRFIYEAAPALHIDMQDPLSAREASELAALCRMLQWEKPISATLLAGWIFLAPICGALAWRPHIWITGGAGTGKTWVQSNIVGPVVGNTAIHPQGVATEAGIRQLLGMDARPVIFDEAEGEDAQAQARIQAIMALARQASSENGGAIIKGSATGKATTYRIRSMFGFSSIGVGVQQYADKTRVTVLAMQIDQNKTDEQRKAHFDALQAKAAGLLTQEYCARLRARAVNMIGAIRENAKTFAAAGASVIGTQRLGDQIGTMLAGAYAMHNGGLITPEDARAWIAKQDWSEEAALNEVKDEQSCLSHILEYVVRVAGDLSTSERSIGELLRAALTKERSGDVGPQAAEEHLLRIGVKIADGGLVIANTHTAVAKILNGTLWAKQWGRILKRLPGAHARNVERYGSGGTHRGVWLPAEVVTGK